MRNIRFLTVMDRMITKDFLKTIFSVLTVLVVIIVSRNFIKILTMAADGLISTEAIISILGMKIVLACANFMVPATFVGVLMVLGRMHRDLEMSALASAGAGVGRLYIAVFKTIIPVTFVAAWMALYASPWAAEQIDQVIYEEQQNIGVRNLAEGKFSEFQHGKLIFYVEKITEDNVMHDVFVQNKRGKEDVVVTAEQAEVRIINNALYIVFINGDRVQGDAGNVDFVFESFSQYGMRLEDSSGIKENSIEGYSTDTLLKTQNLHGIKELYHRLSIPISILVLTIMAVPLAQISPRSGVYGNLATAFLIYFSFANFEKFIASWMVKGEIPIWLGFWGVYFFAFALIVFLLVRLYGLGWVLMRLKRQGL